jgi:hypothetical protein
MEMLNDANIGLDPFSFKSSAKETTFDGGDAKIVSTEASEVKDTAISDDVRHGKKGQKKKTTDGLAGITSRKTNTARPIKLKDKLAAKGLLEKAMMLLQRDADTQRSVQSLTPLQQESTSTQSPSSDGCALLHDTALEYVTKSYNLLFGPLESTAS